MAGGGLRALLRIVLIKGHIESCSIEKPGLQFAPGLQISDACSIIRRNIPPDADDHCCANHHCQRLRYTPKLMPGGSVACRADPEARHVNRARNHKDLVAPGQHECGEGQGQPAKYALDLFERAGHAQQECAADCHRRQAEKNAVQFVSIRPAANIAEHGKPDKVCVKHHPGNERATQAQKDFGKAHDGILVAALTHWFKCTWLHPYQAAPCCRRSTLALRGSAN